MIVEKVPELIRRTRRTSYLADMAVIVVHIREDDGVASGEGHS
jgi:hypothetical protein